MRATSLCALLAVLAISLAACGGDDGPQTSGAAAESIDQGEAVGQIEATAERLQAAIAAKDAKAFCELLAPSDVAKLGGGKSEGRRECLRVWGKANNPLFGARPVPELAVKSVSFDGAYATAELANGGELGFANEEGRWYVHLAPEGEGSGQ